jgi:predicted acyl esterase
MNKRKNIFVLIAIFLLGLQSSILLCSLATTESAKFVDASPPAYEFTVETTWITMKDNVRLSVTFFRPVPLQPDEKFPVLFEFLPYRKDDPVSMGDSRYAQTYAYFARRGFIMARVDIRGTGSSEGVFPLREYSEQELDDAAEIISQLSTMPASNGRVGMWGASWGGFNAIQVAMRQPPALKAIHAAHASDDLYHDDIHYIDGAYHADSWATNFDHYKGLPQTPHWQLDEDYFRDRFNSYPGHLTYLKQQLDGEFWRKNSLRWQFEKIRIPCYLIGGLLDGYKDTPPRMLKNMKVPVKAVMGPWNHSYPDYGKPGPNYEWRHEAVRWWDYWLKDRNTGIMDEPRFAIFIRDGHPPDDHLTMTPGHWVCEDWPVPGTDWKKLFPTENHQLEAEAGKPAEETLRYVPSYGIATSGLTWDAQVVWWGDAKGDMRPDDAGSLVFDSPILAEEFEIVGFPKVHLRVSTDAPLAHWIARLEDIQPDGSVSLITGSLLNGSQRDSRLDPEPLLPYEVYDIEFDMHFTTWTFKPGHRIRLSISNALFPMVWPTPYPMTTKLFLGNESTHIELPVIPSVKRKTPSFLPPEPYEEIQIKALRCRESNRDSSGSPIFEAYFWPEEHVEMSRDMNSTVSVHWKGSRSYEIQDRRFRNYIRDYYETNDKMPEKSRYKGERGKLIEIEGRIVEVRTAIDIQSNVSNFYVTYTRQVFEDGKLLRRRDWKETIPRKFQ